MDHDWLILNTLTLVKHLIYPIIKYSLDQVPPIRVLQSFLEQFFCNSRVDDGTLVFGEHHIFLPASSCDNDWVFATKSILISEWLAMSGFSVLRGELLLCLILAWEWRGDCAWRGDAWLLGSVRTLGSSRWSLVWFNEVLFCEVKSYSKSFEL